MISPHPPRLRMKRRKTVSVTPAMGASTVAGAMRTFPIVTDEGTGCVARAPSPAPGPGLSQYLRTSLFYLSTQKTKPPQKQGLKNPCKFAKSVAVLTSSPAPPWHTSGGSAPHDLPYPAISVCR